MDNALVTLLRAFCALSWVELVNAFVAFVGSLTAFGAINRMNPTTEKHIMVAFITTAAGLAGFAVDAVFPGSWQSICYTLLLGGISAIIVGTRRQTIWIHPSMMKPISVVILVMTWLVFFAGMK